MTQFIAEKEEGFPLFYQDIENVPGVYLTNHNPHFRIIIFPLCEDYPNDTDRARLCVDAQGKVESLILVGGPNWFQGWQNKRFCKIDKNVKISLI